MIALVLGAIIGNHFAGEVGSIVASIISMFVGFKIAGRMSENNKRQWQPQFLRDCPSTAVDISRVDLIHTSKH